MAAAVAAIALPTPLAACSKSGRRFNRETERSRLRAPLRTPASPQPAAPRADRGRAARVRHVQPVTNLDHSWIHSQGRAIKGKDLSRVNIAMVVNVAADYWKAGQTGFQTGCAALGRSARELHLLRPAVRHPDRAGLRARVPAFGQGITGYSISAIDPAVGEGAIASDVTTAASFSRSTRRCPAPRGRRSTLAPRTTEAGFNAGTAMKEALDGTGRGGDPGRLADGGQRH